MKTFRRHPSHTYQGYRFPWYIALLWISFFTFMVWYLIHFLLLRPGA